MMEDMKVMPVVADNQLEETDEQKLARLATEINTIKVQTQAVIQNATLEIGKRLTQAKAAVPHGMWGDWLKTAVDYSERTAQMLISTYERFGGTQQKLIGPQVDSELVSQLSRSQMFALMSIKDEDACIEFMNEHKEELPSMSKRELEQAIKERDQARADIEAWRTQCENLTETADKAAQRAEKLKAELAQLKADTAAGGDEMEKLKAENEKLAEEKDKYEQQLKELKEAQENSENEEIKRLQTETAVRAGRIKDLEREIEELRKIPYLKPAPEKTQEEKAFARYFDNAKEDFEGMLNVLDGMPEELREKYKPAAQKLADLVSGLVQEA